MDLYDIVSRSGSIPEFVSELDRLIPDATPSVTDSDREIWIKVGRRTLVAELKQVLDSIEQEQLEDPANVLQRT